MDQKNKSFIILAIGLAVGAGVMWSGVHFSQVSAAFSGGYFSFNGNRLSNVGAPTASADAATQSYVLTAAAASTPGNWTCTLRTNIVTIGFQGNASVSCSGSEKVVNGSCIGLNSGPANPLQGPGTTGFGTGGQGWFCSGQGGFASSQLEAIANCCQ